MVARTFIIDKPEILPRFTAFLGKQVLPLSIEVREYIAKRSSKANARLWKLHTLAGEVTGYSPEEMHEHALCRHFGFAEKERKNPFTGEIEIKRVPLKRSSQRDKKEFAAFMEDTESWYATDFGVWLGQDDS